MFLRILVLCRGNITRSPFIAGYLHHLYRTSDLNDKIVLDIDSSGIEGKKSQPVHPVVLRKGQEIGFDLAMYRSKHSDLKSMQNADLILVADEQQYRRFNDNFPQFIYKVFKIYDFGRQEDSESLDIQDPSHSEVGFTFDDFFAIALPETERIWKFISDVYRKTVEDGIEFKAELFHKHQDDIETSGRRYNLLTRRLFPICPHCQSKRIRRIKRKGPLQKKLYPRINGYPYHCGTCNRNSILFIGSEIASKRRHDKKYERWNTFLQAEKEYKEADNDKD